MSQHILKVLIDLECSCDEFQNIIWIVSSSCTKWGLGVIYKESWCLKNMKFSKKCLCNNWSNVTH